MAEELAVIEQGVPDIMREDSLMLLRSPEAVLEDGNRAAKALMRVIQGKKDKVMINGKQYLTFEDWQTVGRFFGVTAKVKSTKTFEMGDSGVLGFEATAVAYHAATGREISQADNMCLNDEDTWRDKPLFQLRSMAQTRACAKALRNVLAWVVVLAGYSPTPAEEMVGQPQSRPAQSRAPKEDSKKESSGSKCTEKQRKMLYAIWTSKGWQDDVVKALLKKHWDVDSSKDVLFDDVNDIKKYLENTPPKTLEEVANG